MINIILIRESIRKRNTLILDIIIIKRGDFLAMLVILVKISQFNIKNGSLDFIQTTIASGIFENIFLLAAIISKGTNGLCQGLIICCYRPAITKST